MTAVTGLPAKARDRSPWLPRALEHQLVLAAKDGDHDARDALVDAFMPLVASVARLYRGSAAVNRQELMQEGVVGLLRALERYDTTLDTPFWAYASWWVRQAMQQLVSQLTRPVVLSDRAIRQLTRLREARREHLRAHGREPTCDQLAATTSLGHSQVADLIVAERSSRTLDEPLRSEEGAGATLGDLIADPHAEDAYERVPERLAVEALPQLLRELSEREQRILSARFGLQGPERTLRDIAGELGVSPERVRQIEQRALAKLRTVVDEAADRRICT
ncbi:MAG TPA: sigma-70 family RNA polymerase sigma factor [Solirubrobacteraceae bacterium]|nr:sigma-70 family RNA polymerase sigma factor [Solirubrobacteraceae bacterium]